MTHSGDDDRSKLTFAELDKLRREGGSPGGKRPRGRWAQAQAERATDQYKKHLDSLFSSDPGGKRGEELAAEMREAHGTDGFVAACRAYCDEVGFPVDPELIGLVLDTGDADLVVGMLEAILDGVSSGAFELSKGLRTQVGTLAEDFNASIADVAEEILEQL